MVAATHADVAIRHPHDSATWSHDCQNETMCARPKSPLRRRRYEIFKWRIALLRIIGYWMLIETTNRSLTGSQRNFFGPRSAVRSLWPNG